ncbi:hypothetical protein FOMPIDRAFT_54138 [Fomitopsis schrenkii]|uniref:Reverse transcriptase zinc-binding domain-containing protein n=1 Tax=Fomitopsis schrenkii TaxID=2126942 RepID=S8FLT3_FOMSC|nr:hypothetical protein FOMPIDRAFT_54138 [Fomitopsis schrenkii]
MLAQPPALRKANGRVVEDEASTAWISYVGEKDQVNEGRRGGLAYFDRDDQRNALVNIPTVDGGECQILGELAAALYIVQETPKDAPLNMKVSRPQLRTILCEQLEVWEARGWVGVRIAPMVRALATALRKRCAPTTIEVITEDQDKRGMNEIRAWAGAVEEDSLPRRNHPDLTIEPRFNLTGAELTHLTQALAYKGIQERQKVAQRPTSARNMERLRGLQAAQGSAKTEAQIWKSLYHKDIKRKISDFMWRALHGALKIGPFWTKVAGLEHRAECPKCETSETLEHIVSECNAQGQSVVWEDAQRLWEKTGLPWEKQTSDGVILAAHKQWKDVNTGKTKKGLERLWRIIVSESLHVIWRLRCERVIGHAGEEWEHHPDAVRATWRGQISERLRLDTEMTKRKYGRKALAANLVLSTWTPVLLDVQALPDDWTKQTGFLVGRAPMVQIDFDQRR